MALGARVVDTSVWLEGLTGSALGKRRAKEIPEKPNCIVPTIVELELAKWLTREVGKMGKMGEVGEVGADETDRVIAYTQKRVVIPLDTRLALLAVALHRSHKPATAEAIIYALARDRSVPLLTCDARFEGLP